MAAVASPHSLDGADAVPEPPPGSHAPLCHAAGADWAGETRRVEAVKLQGLPEYQCPLLSEVDES